MKNELFPPWFRRRYYLHFDLPVSLTHAQSVVLNPEIVAKHAFYPFLHSVITTVKLSKNKVTNKVERQKKTRDIACAAHLDSHIYSYYAHALSQSYENKIKEARIHSCVLAFRVLGKNNIEFALNAFRDITARGPCDAIALDIKGFFDNLDHDILKSAWSRVIESTRLPPDHFNLYKSLTKWCQVNKAQLYAELGMSVHNPKKGGRKRICEPDVFRTKVRAAGLLKRNSQAKGIPQGSPISAVLSNIYMLSFDERLNDFALSIGATYMRYCDDIMIVAPEGTRETIKAFVGQLLKDVKLEAREEKTEERTFSVMNGRLGTTEPLQYLGFIFDGRNVRVRSSSISRYFDRMRQGVKTAKNTKRKYNKIRSARKRQPRDLYLKKIYRRYSYLGRRNFISYGCRSASIMSSDSIKKQIKVLWNKLLSSIET